VAVRVVHSLFN